MTFLTCVRLLSLLYAERGQDASSADVPGRLPWLDAIIKDAGTIVPKLPLPAFVAHLLPPLFPSLDTNFDDICRELAQPASKDTIPAYMGGVWTAWKTQEKRKKPAEQAFAAFLKIADAIRDAVTTVVPGHPGASLDFTDDPNDAPWSGFGAVKTRPDGYFIRRSRDSPTSPHWMDIVATGEYQVKEEVSDVCCPLSIKLR